MNTLVRRYLAPTKDFQLNSSSPPSEGENSNEEIIDYSDATLKFISEMLMDEDDDDDDLETDCLALQATEKSLYDALTNDLKRNPEIPDDTETVERNARETKKNRCHEDSDVCETFEALEMYDHVVLDGLMQTCGENEIKQTKAKFFLSPENKQPNRRRRGKKQDAVDLQSLLTQCAQAMADFDRITVNELFVRIRHHASPQGDGDERLAYHFANALEARLSGTGSTLHAEFSLLRMSETTPAANILKAYKSYITAFPLKTMSHLMANKTIEKLATTTTTTALHIVDFGIRYGHQWPSLIQALSERPGGPPKLRITGIECPQPGFGPAEEVTNTGLRLAKYCKRFGVPFEYNAVARKWDSVKLEDLGIEKNHELVVVNCLYRLHNVLDETELGIVSPRDVVLDLIRSINPDMFVHGIDNGTYSTPFFVARFKEALFHFASLFDMFEATMGREDGDRQLVEQVYGSDVINIVACEGVERIQRPDTYKQWQARHREAGFRQVPFDPMILKYVRRKVESDYHKAFSVDEDGKWVLHGWKGRVHSAISCWQPCA